MRGTDSAAERHQAASEELMKACGDFRTALADHRDEPSSIAETDEIKLPAWGVGARNYRGPGMAG